MRNQPLVIILFFPVIAILSFLPFYPSLAQPVSPSENLSPEKFMAQGLTSFQRGAFEQAVIDWKEAARLYEKERKANKQSEALTLLAQAYQYVGQYSEALKSLKSALALAKSRGSEADRHCPGEPR